MAWRRDRDRPRRRQTDPPTPSFAWRRLADSGPTERETLRFGPAAWWTSPGSYSYGTHRRFFCIVWDTVRGHMIYLLPLTGEHYDWIAESAAELIEPQWRLPPWW